MSQKTKASLTSGVSSNFPDNTSSAITPLATRTQHIDEIDSALNLIETATQTVTGLVNFTGGLQISGADVTASPFVLIMTASDFPVQDGSSITLESKKIYVLGADLSTAKYFTCEDAAALTGFNILGYTLTYTGTGAMFRGTDASFIIRNIQKNHPNGEGYSFNDTVGGQKLFISEKVRTISGTKYGTFDDMQTVLIEGSSVLDMDDGISLSGSNMIIFSISKFFMGSTDVGFTGIDFGSAIIQSCEVDNFICNGPSGAIGISGLASSGNIPAGRTATVKNSEFGGGLTPLQNLDSSDVRWIFRDNTLIPDSITDALLSLNGNATATVISTIDTPVLVAGTWVVERSSRMTCTTAGRATFDREVDEVMPVDVIVYVEPVSGTNILITAYIALNGSVITNSEKQVSVSAGTPLPASIPWQINFSENDYVEVYVENNTNTTNILVSEGVSRVR